MHAEALQPPVVSLSEEFPRILIVDDESVILDVLKDVLEFEGFHVSVAGNGEKALESLKHDSFDLVLTDLKMPGVDGLEVIRRVSESGTDTVTIIMTGFGTVETAIDAMKKGAFDYILKPFKPEDVVRVLRRGLERQRTERENIALRQTISFYELSEALTSTMPLDEQLDMIVRLVRDNFGADGVSVTIEDPNLPGKYLDSCYLGPVDFRPKIDRLVATFIQNKRVLVHGEQACEWLENWNTADYKVQSFMSAPMRIRGAPIGVLNAYSTNKGHRFTEGQRKGLAVFGGRAANAVETARIYGNLKETFTQTIEGFARALEAKDTYTHGHSDRVAMYARLIGETMGLPSQEINRIQHGGLMHDVGKIGIRSQDLNKAQKLTPAEYQMFRSHPVLGKRIIEPIAFLTHLVPCVYHHHEAWDGSGYPDSLSGNDIPREARILAVADTYDAMTSNRPYRKALPHEIALLELKRCANKQFDPQAVEAFLATIEDFRRQRTIQGLAVPD